MSTLPRADPSKTTLAEDVVIEPSRRPLPSALRLYLALVLVLTAFTGLVLLRLYLLHVPMDHAMVWSLSDDRFGDFWHYHALFRFFHTQRFFTSRERFAYPAPCAVLYAFLYRLPRPHVIFNVLTLFALGVSAVFFFRMLQRFDLRNLTCVGVTLTLVLTSYPWERLYDRGNLELFVYVLLALGLWANLTGRSVISAILWGLAGALKIYPLAMLAVYINRKTVWPLMAGLAGFAICLFTAFWYVGPSIPIAARGTIEGMTGFVANYAANARRTELTIDHSVLGAIKEFVSMHMWHLGNNWTGLSRLYELCAAVVLPVLFFTVIRKLPLLNQLGFLLIAVALFPPVSYDYTLIHTYLVMGLVCGAYFFALQRGKTLPHIRIFFIAFAFLATPQTWMNIESLSLNGPIKCCALLLLCYLLLRVPLTMGLSVERLWEEN